MLFVMFLFISRPRTAAYLFRYWFQRTLILEIDRRPNILFEQLDVTFPSGGEGIEYIVII